ncbi:hypothetical protein H6P81_011776 [Aristolochia fimbriata]|uniref:Uncharacterized protein n=1 Tax=Aristolochia fimbriata TaxID=158543 RepID=A0AAV7EAA8_ARIFI|nr:hypothetical protein H6P81_011776 [Aristolochia fimbriata]
MEGEIKQTGRRGRLPFSSPFTPPEAAADRTTNASLLIQDQCLHCTRPRSIRKTSYLVLQQIERRRFPLYNHVYVNLKLIAFLILSSGVLNHGVNVNVCNFIELPEQLITANLFPYWKRMNGEETYQTQIASLLISQRSMGLDLQRVPNSERCKLGHQSFHTGGRV